MKKQGGEQEFWRQETSKEVMESSSLIQVYSTHEYSERNHAESFLLTECYKH